ncbi:MAG: serine hydrolase [Gammaproteobacteria bacterium]|nr:serine hydrolase [Gammaproteobacteria bacterium]
MSALSGCILSRESVELMTTDQLGDDIPWVPGHGFGLGFGILRDIDRDGRPSSTIEFHWNGGYHTMFWVDPAEKLTVVYMAQLRRAIGLDDFRRIRALVYQALTRKRDASDGRRTGPSNGTRCRNSRSLGQ